MKKTQSGMSVMLTDAKFTLPHIPTLTFAVAEIRVKKKILVSCLIPVFDQCVIQVKLNGKLVVLTVNSGTRNIYTWIWNPPQSCFRGIHMKETLVLISPLQDFRMGKLTWHGLSRLITKTTTPDTLKLFCDICHHSEAR